MLTLYIFHGMTHQKWGIYPLVNIQKAIQHHHFHWVNQLEMGIFQWQTVCFPEGIGKVNVFTFFLETLKQIQGRQVYFALFSQGFSAFGLARRGGRASSNAHFSKPLLVMITGDFTIQHMKDSIIHCRNSALSQAKWNDNSDFERRLTVEFFSIWWVSAVGSWAGHGSIWLRQASELTAQMRLNPGWFGIWYH